MAKAHERLGLRAPYQPRQGFLLPPSPFDWLPEDHLAYFILETVSQLDLADITAHYEREHRGFPPHDPRMMVALLLHTYCVGVPSIVLQSPAPPLDAGLPQPQCLRRKEPRSELKDVTNLSLKSREGHPGHQEPWPGGETYLSASTARLGRREIPCP